MLPDKYTIQISVVINNFEQSNKWDGTHPQSLPEGELEGKRHVIDLKL